MCDFTAIPLPDLKRSGDWQALGKTEGKAQFPYFKE